PQPSAPATYRRFRLSASFPSHASVPVSRLQEKSPEMPETPRRQQGHSVWRSFLPPQSPPHQRRSGARTRTIECASAPKYRIQLSRFNLHDSIATQIHRKNTSHPASAHASHTTNAETVTPVAPNLYLASTYMHRHE